MARVQVEKVSFENFRSFEVFEVSVPPGGMTVEGANGQGKSTVLDGIRAALFGRECDADDIRAGADEARITLATTAGIIVRRITPKGSTLGGKTVDGAKPSQEWIAKTFGDPSSIDPSKLLALDERDLARKVLDMCPAKVTAEHLARWGVPADHGADLSAHGLAVVEQLRARYYDARKAANAVADDRARRVPAMESAAAAATVDGEAPADGLSVADAQRTLDAAKAEHTALLRAVADAKAAEQRAAGTRERVLALRSVADALNAATDPVSEEAMEESRADVARCEQRVAELEAALAEARELLKAERAELAKRDAINRTAAEDSRRAASLRQQADALEAAVDGTLPRAPSPDEIAAAETAAADAAAALQSARDAAAQRAAYEAAVAAAKAAAEAVEAAREAAAEAKRATVTLDTLVRTLTDIAPGELVADGGGIPGLSIVDGKVSVRGVPFRKLNTAQRSRFAVDLALLANPKCGWIQVDNLEHFDRAGQQALIDAIHARGLTPICGLVSEHALVIRPAGPPPAAEDDLGSLFD